MVDIFVERLKRLRLKTGISQAKLADELGLAKKTIERWERGENNPQAETICVIAEYFSVSVDYLLGKTDDSIGKTNEVNENRKSFSANLQLKNREVPKRKRDSLTGILNIIFDENISTTERMLWKYAINNIKVDSSGKLFAEINTIEQIFGLDFTEIESCTYSMLQRKIAEKNGSTQILIRSTLNNHTLRFVFNPLLKKEILEVSQHIEEWY